MADMLLRVPDVARMLRISERKVWTLIENGTLIRAKLPSVRATLVRLSDVQSLIASSRMVAGSRVNVSELTGGVQ